jgi:hypothetical protein
MQWVPNEKKEQPEQEPDDLTIAYMAGFYDGKNTPHPKPEQEPVANGIIRTLVSIDKDGIETWKHEPFYTAPPKREWVGLTDAEIADIANLCRWSNTYHADFARAIEAKLREKNGG